MCLSLAGRVVTLDARGTEATVDVDGARRRVSLALLVLEAGTTGATDGAAAPVRPGDWVLVHSGLVVSRLEPDAAAELVALHRSLHEPPGKEAP